MLYKLFIKVSITGEKNMDIPKIIAEDLLKLKDLKKLVIFLLCVLVCCFGVFVYDNYVIKEQQNQIKMLKDSMELISYNNKKLKNKIERGCLSITYPPQTKNKYNAPKDYFSMQHLLNNNIIEQTSTDKWEEEINKNLNLLKSVVTAEQYNLLQKSQKQWDEYKTAELDFINDLFFSSSPGGNMWGSLFYLYELKLIEDRAEILHSLYDDACFLQQIRKEWKEYMQEEAENENPVN